MKIDVVIRITADCPYIDDEFCQYLLESHFATGADYTTAREAAVGTNLEVINVQALEKVKRYFPEANYSEYMTWYFRNNPEHFKLNYIELPAQLVRDYRMTLDYQEDLDMFNKIEDHFKEQKKIDFTLREIYQFLDANPEVAKLNQNIPVSYKSNQELIDLLNRVTKINAG
jgi:spore coat polysaccharide biosynthesis protein SpsF (cytidylyltransferase family)